MAREDVYLGMRAGDLDGKPYARHWKPEMAPLQPPVREAILQGPQAAELAFPLGEAHRLLEPGALPMENGWAQTRSGETFVAVQTLMPGVRGSMFEWWMGWHTEESQRYKLWHPRAHLAVATSGRSESAPLLSERTKYLTTHLVTEYIGNARQEIRITFTPPTQWFPTGTDLSAGGTTALVCGEVRLRAVPVTIGYLIHQIREGGSHGTEMRSRFWLGSLRFGKVPREHWSGRLLSRSGLAARLHPGELGRDMVVHCGMEMAHLATFLPALWADYHP